MRDMRVSGELRALGVAHGLLLGLLLTSPWLAPGLMRWGVEAYFMLGGFALRLADRRLAMRSPLAGWISHIRMAPRRIAPWGAMATAALIAGEGTRAQAILLAAALCELLLYPVLAPMMARLSRRAVGVILLLLLASGARAVGETIDYILAFTVGMAACLFWLRGPDGDARALGLTAMVGTAAAIGTVILPATTAIAFPATVACATLTLAHLSVQRRRPVPWRPDGSPALMRPAKPLR